MDVALRATLKEFGFKRKSRTNYVCEHLPERTWVFEIEPMRQHHPFRDWSGIFVPEIENIITRAAPEIGTNETFLRSPTQFKTSIVELIEISRGWDEPSWERNPKSRHWLWGYRFPPSITKVIPLWDGGWWNTDHAKAVLDRSRTAREIKLRNIEPSWREISSPDRQETAEAVGRELETLWREHAHDWLQKCDDLRYLAEWFDKHVFSPGHPGNGTTAFTAATAWHLVGNSLRAAEILNGVIAENEPIAEDGSEISAEQFREYSDLSRSNAKATRNLADELGIKLSL